MQPGATEDNQAQAPAEGACGLTPAERKSVIDALLQEIDKTQKWTRLVSEMQAEIASLRGDLEVGRLQLEAAAGEIERLRSLTRFQDGVIRSGDVACLAEAEREAVRSCIADDEAATAYQRAATLRGLLERMK